eukprot:CAMPEP_0172319272 /NCGR_PEP_ID=MMETSP1058-20130122/37259_1 /TAXON_ID=83371 /ORGANISM="Detonula confervacea, Strain CCMP 353" /LENGTH=73 /DNA_ID=CAMNT_0013034277 /DNA_START=18 /DNA_END=235 /DNA_ORIENTATION=+
MPSEGCREIEAVKQRVAAANAQLDSARAMEKLKLAKEMRWPPHRKNMESSQTEVKEATAFLKEAEKRWEVIDV